jgi:hypothetical protein
MFRDRELHTSYATVLKVLRAQDRRGITLEVALQPGKHRARVRLAWDYIGDGFGAVRAPHPGDEVLCVFPGKDINAGIATKVLSNKGRRLPVGIEGQWDGSQILTVYEKGKRLDTTIQHGNVELHVTRPASDPDDPDVEVLDLHVQTEPHAAATDHATQVHDAGLEPHSAEQDCDPLDGDGGHITMDLRVVGKLRLRVAGTVHLVSENVHVGDPDAIGHEVQKLVREEFKTRFDGHRHDNAGGTGLSGAVTGVDRMVIDVDTTTHVKAV